VFVERLLLAERTVWLRAGSPRFVVAISPAQLTRLTTARPADLVAEV
jgi:prolyl-tRNA editing enzyme YbaK/EbsC (Cys-tRNA(Pro) deacylase)